MYSFAYCIDDLQRNDANPFFSILIDINVG